MKTFVFIGHFTGAFEGVRIKKAVFRTGLAI